MGAFDSFNWPYQIKKVSVVPGYTQQTGSNAGEWVPEITTETAISAHVSDVSQKELQYLDPGLVLRGVRKLGCERSAGLAVGDRIKVTEMDGVTETEWIVHTKQYSTGLLQKHAGIDRETFLLERRT